MISGAIVPHAPLLIERLACDETRRAGDAVRASVGALDLGRADLVILLSPHGARTGVYGALAGSLHDHGVGGVEASQATDAAALRALAEAWGVEVLDQPADHGVVVPLLLREWRLPVVAACFEDEAAGGGPPAERATELGRALADAVEDLAESAHVALVASANGAIGLTPRAPLTELPGALAAERDLLAAIEEDVGLVEDAARTLAAAGGSCAVGPLTALARLLSGRPGRVLVHECPVGVGYLVAEVGP